MVAESGGHLRYWAGPGMRLARRILFFTAAADRGHGQGETTTNVFIHLASDQVVCGSHGEQGPIHSAHRLAFRRDPVLRSKPTFKGKAQKWLIARFDAKPNLQLSQGNHEFSKIRCLGRGSIPPVAAETSSGSCLGLDPCDGTRRIRSVESVVILHPCNLEFCRAMTLI